MGIVSARCGHDRSGSVFGAPAAEKQWGFGGFFHPRLPPLLLVVVLVLLVVLIVVVVVAAAVAVVVTVNGHDIALSVLMLYS